MAVTEWLIDKSALVRIEQFRVPDAGQWLERIDRGLIHLPAIARLELGFWGQHEPPSRRTA